MEYHESVLGALGNTPLVRLDSVLDGHGGDDGPLVLAKVEYFNPGGSVKDRIGISMIEAAEEAGDLGEGGTVVESTSGNTGIGLALAALEKGYDCVFTTSEKQSPMKMKILAALGAEVVICPSDVEPEDEASYYSQAEAVAEERPGSFYVNQYFNDANPEAHVGTTGPEIWEQTDGEVTHWIAGVGTGGTISGTGKYLKEQDPSVEVVGVDPEGSILKDRHETGDAHPEKAHSYLVEGIGEDLIPSTVWYDVVDDFVQVGDQESYAYARRLAAEEGILSGSSAGSAVCGVKRYLETRGPLDEDDVVVTLIPDWGQHYINRVFDDEWMGERGLLEAARKATDAAGTIRRWDEEPEG
jgi:cystathionine beta-synthase